MRIGEICTRDVVFCPPETGIREAARLMREYHVGTLVIAENRDGRRVPVGIVTDRDLVVEVLAIEAPFDTVTIGDLRTSELVTAREQDDAFETLEQMRRRGVRRMPVVDAQGGLVGIVSLDDLLEIVAEELQSMVKLISRQRLRESAQRPPLPPH
ncbi:MAG TPA: CBS domain-containing protein [Burkholderiales bacterium]